MNGIFVLGYLGIDPNITKASNGVSCATFSIASKKRKPIGEDTINWFNVIIFGDIVDNFIEPYLKKGDQVLVHGTFDFYEYIKKDGSTVKSSRITADNLRLVKNGANNKSEVNIDEVM